MRDPARPDFANTPASAARPAYAYAPREMGAPPTLSILTPFYNTGPEFAETARAVRRMSFAAWEWLLVDDGSTDPASLERLERLAAEEPRVRVIRQANAGPAVARNRAAREARGRYLLQLDSDDLIEPTFAEKALWFLATQPQFAACNSWNLTFGRKTLLWPHGFEHREECLGENWITNMAVIQRDAWRAAGGYDERISYEHADWDFWLNLAQAGFWGHTLTEYLTWYRTRDSSLLTEIEGDHERARAFAAWLRAKHAGLGRRFPHPRWRRDIARPLPPDDEAPLANPLAKPDGVGRILSLVPWLEVGGADKFNLDVIRALAPRGYEFTVVATRHAPHTWLSEFARLTPDVFCLSRFLDYADYLRFLDYLIASRGIDAVLVSNSELGYGLLPYLRARHPRLALLDYTHMEDHTWLDGGYPVLSLRAGPLLDLRLTATDHLRRWMIERGAEPAGVATQHCDIDTQEWAPEKADAAAVRERLGIAPETAVILFVGRLVEQKRPLLCAEIVRRLAARRADFVSLIAGDGLERGKLKAFVARHGLGERIKLLGGVPNEAVRDLLAAADILLLPSAHEGLSLALYEAMAMETTPVVADVGGHAELVTPECGCLIPRGAAEVEAYVAALDALLSDPTRRRAMARAARRRVVERFDLGRLAGGMSSALARACALALAREETTDPKAARAAAQAAVDAERRLELPDLPADGGARMHAMRLARRARYLLLPAGSRRFAVYRRLRQEARGGLRLAHGRLARLRQRILALAKA